MMTSQSSDASDAPGTIKSEKTLLSSRRSWISTTGLATSALFTQSAILSAFPGIASAAQTSLETFKDEKLKFEIKVPTNWEKQVQSLPDRRKIVLFIDPTSDKDKNLVFFAFTPVRDDFTSLSSFGSVDQVLKSCYSRFVVIVILFSSSNHASFCSLLGRTNDDSSERNHGRRREREQNDQS